MNKAKSFEFSSYNFDQNSGKIAFDYQIIFDDSEKIEFREELFTPLGFSVTNPTLVDQILQNLHLILGISYYKLFCPPTLLIKAFQLTKEQAEFWNTVYTKGLGEFFYRNNIDYRGLVSFPFSTDTHANPQNINVSDRVLLPIGGGKDSIVSGELLKKANLTFDSFALNSTNIQDQTVSLMGSKLINVVRNLDPKLLEMNKREDTYNGHVPISAVYSFVSLLVAALLDYKYIVFSNEKSANYGNVEYLGSEINHQWSKSHEFEQLFSYYLKTNLTKDITAFSLLRALSEIKIVEIFSKFDKYFPVFSSCNSNFRVVKDLTLSENQNNIRGVVSWCGECPKCAFGFCMLSAFLPKEQVVSIIGEDLYNKPSLRLIYRQLLGLEDIKPWECVGTPEEVKLGFYLAHQTNTYEEDVHMQMFVQEVLPDLKNIDELKANLLSIDSDHNLAEKFKVVLENLK